MSKKKLILRILGVVLVIGVSLAMTHLFYDKPYNQDENNLPQVDPTASVTQQVVITPSAVPEITNAPSVTPEVIYIATVAPVPTATFAPVVTWVPTATPVPTATLVPTATPARTATPAPIVTHSPVSTATPVPTSDEMLEKFSQELYKMTSGANEILPTYTDSKKFDLYNYVSFEYIDQFKLFEVLKGFFVNTIAHSFDFDFENTNNDIVAVLNSSYCSECGKLKCVYKTENTAKMNQLLSGVSTSEVARINEALIYYLFENTIAGESVIERLVFEPAQ